MRARARRIDSTSDTGMPFDRFAEASADFVSRGAFFAACLLLVVI